MRKGNLNQSQLRPDSSPKHIQGFARERGGLTASSHCIFAELSWVPAELSQREDRLHRIGTEDSVTVQHLVLAGSLNAMMVHVLLKKQKVLDAVLSEPAVS
jgi:SWI/SNF-related matrix-associated actin-dependent regulator 1 of chromatin subfamily A